MKLFKNLLLGTGLALAAGTALSAQELGQLHYRAEAGLAISRISALGVHHNRFVGGIIRVYDNKSNYFFRKVLEIKLVVRFLDNFKYPLR